MHNCISLKHVLARLNTNAAGWDIVNSLESDEGAFLPILSFVFHETPGWRERGTADQRSASRQGLSEAVAV